MQPKLIPAPAMAISPGRTLSPEMELSDPLVYVIDTDVANRRLIAQVLKEALIEHLVYDSTTAFLDSYEDRGPGCVLVDIRMPVISGVQLIGRMKEMNLGLSTILMTSHSDVGSVIRGFREGAADVFMKPIDESKVLERIHFEIEESRIVRMRQRKIAEARLRIAMLTDREKQVMALLVQGETNKRIAYKLNLSSKTVGAHRCNIMNKLEIKSLAQMIALNSSDLITGFAFDGKRLP